MDKVRIGIIGCGGFSNRHLENLQKMEDVEVVALSSPDKNRLESTGLKAPGAQLFSDHHDLLDNVKNLDGAFICVPPDSHGDMETYAAGKGVNIYVEKPVSFTLKRAYEVNDVIKKAGIITAAGYMERYDEAVDEIKAFISGREVGLANCWWFGGPPPAFSWWHTKERSGGQLVEQCTHMFDLMRYFFGEARTVYSRGVTGIVKGIPGYTLDDASMTTIDFLNGVVVSIQAAVYFNDDSVIPNGIGVQVLCKDAFVENNWQKQARFTTGGNVRKIDTPSHSHYNSARAFVQAVKTGNRDYIRSTYPDAIKSLALTLAANESIVSGMPVSV